MSHSGQDLAAVTQLIRLSPQISERTIYHLVPPISHFAVKFNQLDREHDLTHVDNNNQP